MGGVYYTFLERKGVKFFSSDYIFFEKYESLRQGGGGVHQSLVY